MAGWKTMMNIEVARAELASRIAECAEAKRALCSASNNKAKSLASEIFQGRSLAVDQAAAHLAALLGIAKAQSVIPAFRTLAGDLAFVTGLQRRAASVGAAPELLTMLTHGLEIDLISEIAPAASHSARRQIDDLVSRLKQDPFAIL
jgi:hypothetical protein